MDMKLDPEITVEPLGGDDAVWESLLARAANATLFHDLQFLRYHPVERFRFQHLVFREDGKPIALLPGGLSSVAGQTMFSSPLGASIGGFAVGAGLRAERAVNLIRVLQSYARSQGWDSIEITLPPLCYSIQTLGLMEFALFCSGFRIARRWLCPMLPLGPGEQNSYEQIFRKRQREYVRAAHRKGMVAIEAGVEAYDHFIKVFRDTYDRHGVSATHSPDEIRDLLQRLPDRVRVHLAILGGVPVAGLLVFRLSATVANTFYICTGTEHAGEHGALFVIADLIERLSQAGFRYIDFGPSASDQKLNKGAMFFKEGLGAAGQCRDRWRWETE
jgi:Acetyltransferase (GNAT) domain